MNFSRNSFPASAYQQLKNRLTSSQSETGIDMVAALALSSIMVFSMAGFGIITPVLADIQEWGKLSTTQVGIYFSAFGLARFSMNLPAGYIIDRFGGRFLTIVSLSIITAGSLMSALAPTYPFLFAGRILTGVGSAFTSIAITTRLLLLSDSSHRATVFSYSMISRRTGASIFPFVGGVLAALFGWRAVFYFTVLLNLSGIYIAYHFFNPKKTPAKKEKDRDSRTPKADEEDPAKTAPRIRVPLPTILTVYLLAFTMFMNRNGLEKTVIPLFGSSIGLDSVMIGLTLSVSGFVSILAIFFGGRIADKYGRRLVVLVGTGILLLTNGLFLLVNNFPMYFTVNMFFAISAFTMALPMIIAGDVTPREEVGKTVGTVRLFTDGGMVAGPILLSWVMDHYSFSASIGVSMVMVSILIVMAALFLKEPARNT